ncbi:MAG: hypothetical protein KGJ89_02455 [Patescibacteria group bacterium]|nr:hypothetical protein [Patescibacteria group bacterium]MDE2015740.1 hypothetical protein [Patescibacteria group bacterium]MDE2226797.1 hypothetical protein [Patescibacteria group bacterium]
MPNKSEVILRHEKIWSIGKIYRLLIGFGMKGMKFEKNDNNGSFFGRFKYEEGDVEIVVARSMRRTDPGIEKGTLVRISGEFSQTNRLARKFLDEPHPVKWLVVVRSFTKTNSLSY